VTSRNPEVFLPLPLPLALLLPLALPLLLRRLRRPYPSYHKKSHTQVFVFTVKKRKKNKDEKISVSVCVACCSYLRFLGFSPIESESFRRVPGISKATVRDLAAINKINKIRSGHFRIRIFIQSAKTNLPPKCRTARPRRGFQSPATRSSNLCSARRSHKQGVGHMLGAFNNNTFYTEQSRATCINGHPVTGP
jgi:hypothetical protein